MYVFNIRYATKESEVKRYVNGINIFQLKSSFIAAQDKKESNEEMVKHYIESKLGIKAPIGFEIASIEKIPEFIVDKMLEMSEENFTLSESVEDLSFELKCANSRIQSLEKEKENMIKGQILQQIGR